MVFEQFIHYLKPVMQFMIFRYQDGFIMQVKYFNRYYYYWVLFDLVIIWIFNCLNLCQIMNLSQIIKFIAQVIKSIAQVSEFTLSIVMIKH